MQHAKVKLANWANEAGYVGGVGVGVGASCVGVLDNTDAVDAEREAVGSGRAGEQEETTAKANQAKKG